MPGRFTGLRDLNRLHLLWDPPGRCERPGPQKVLACIRLGKTKPASPLEDWLLVTLRRSLWSSLEAFGLETEKPENTPKTVSFGLVLFFVSWAAQKNSKVPKSKEKQSKNTSKIDLESRFLPGPLLKDRPLLPFKDLWHLWCLQVVVEGRGNSRGLCGPRIYLFRLSERAPAAVFPVGDGLFFFGFLKVLGGSLWTLKKYSKTPKSTKGPGKRSGPLLGVFLALTTKSSPNKQSKLHSKARVAHLRSFFSWFLFTFKETH